MNSFIISIVGRPNVGKSTLFNRIIGEQKALVHDFPGVTRDRLYGTSTWRIEDEIVPFTLIDTGGLEQGANENLQAYVARQVQVAIDQSDLIIAVVDGRAGLLPEDEALMKEMRKSGKPIALCVNKIDTSLAENVMAPFYALGFSDNFAVSAQHNRGIEELMQGVLKNRPQIVFNEEALENEPIRLAIIGRPNVGKSRLLNYLCGEERSVVSPEAGTTRDPIDSKVHYKGADYLLVDTAGIRRQAKIDETLEYLSTLRSLRAVGRSDIAILVIDATEGVTQQELRLASYIWDRGRGLICFYNKCDLIDEKPPKELRNFPNAAVCSGAAKMGQGMEPLMKLTKRVISSFRKRVKTSRLNDLMENITANVPPPAPKGKPLKIRYITQTGTTPPRFQIFVNNLDRLSKNYQKYIENALYKELGLTGVPIKIEYRDRE